MQQANRAPGVHLHQQRVFPNRLNEPDGQLHPGLNRQKPVNNLLYIFWLIRYLPFRDGVHLSLILLLFLLTGSISAREIEIYCIRNLSRVMFRF